ncbi:MAG: hybrid sensor histidine kinase/response regulator [Janthinobacterium lividum]
MLNRLGADGVMNAWRMLDLFHPDDHLAVSRAHKQAAAAGSGEIASHSSCDCRLLRADGSAAWVRAQFMKPASPASGTVATLVDIDGRIHLENALYENQRRLDAQTQELAAQFDASKKALHARQEVERLAQHDLKSPLKSIATAASMLRDGRSLSDTEEALLASIERTAGRALAIVSMSLDLYRMEEGTFRFVREIVDLGEIGRSVVADISLHACTKNVELSFCGGTGPHRVVGNEVFVTSVVENLVRNAVEAAPEHSTVRLCVREDTTTGIGLEIHNQGSVPEAIRNNFFEKYVTHGKRDGLGLGTYSARLIARAQGGDLHMSSSDDNGTTLTLELKRDTGDLAPSPAASAVSDTPMPTSALSSYTPQATLSPVDLLVVEDDDHNWLLLSSWLPDHVRARRAINGRDAIDALIRRRPDLVIMDLEMPVMNGFEALQQIREMQSGANEEASVVVAFTGYDDMETTRRIEAAGFDGKLSKPAVRTALDALLSTIDKQELPAHARTVWIEKRFAAAFPDFIASRRALIDNIEQAAAANDLAGARRAAHTLAGSPAIHEFDAGIAICREIVASGADVDRAWLADRTRTLRAMLANPPVR